MTAGAAVDGETTDLLRQAARLEAASRHEEALSLAWRAVDSAPGSRAAKATVARLLQHRPDAVDAARSDDLLALLGDAEVDPFAIAPAGWSLQVRDGLLSDEVEPADQARRLEGDGFARRLLEESYVRRLDVEQALTKVRKWLLLSGRWPEFPLLTAALRTQAALNGGAWLFDAAERTRLDEIGDPELAALYLPPRPTAAAPGDDADVVTRDTREHYESWPYPAWTRITVPPPDSLKRVVEGLCGDADFPECPGVLLAGCGTGHEAAHMAAAYPDARITAIDLSATAVAVAERQCARWDIDFRCLDLHRVADLGRRFDFILCGGVIQTLPDPEAGWARLLDVLNPGGVMRVMVNSRIAHLPVHGARRLAADLLGQRIDDDLLRAIRRRMIEQKPDLLGGSADFYTLAGMRVLFHNHEDAFDVPRIARALERFGLELLCFRLPSAASAEQYRREHPDDAGFRDVAAWAAFEKGSPFVFTGMYDFWCRKPGPRRP